MTTEKEYALEYDTNVLGGESNLIVDQLGQLFDSFGLDGVKEDDYKYKRNLQKGDSPEAPSPAMSPSIEYQGPDTEPPPIQH